MAVTILIVSVLASGLTLVDQLRRPPSAWIAADRRRGYWITLTVITGLACLGVLTALAYAIGVLPRFAIGREVDPAFRKADRTPTAQAPRRTAPQPRPAPHPPPLWLPRDSPPAPARPGPPGQPTGSRKLIIEFDDV